jgi:hypothetical protein
MMRGARRRENRVCKQDREEHGYEHCQLRGTPFAGVVEDGRDRAGTCEQRDGEREHGDVVLVGILLLLAHGLERSPLGLAKIMSSASKKSRIPPAIRNAGMLIPNASSSTSPARAKTNRMTVPRTVPRIAASRLRFSE